LHISKVFNWEFEILQLPNDPHDLLKLNIQGISIRAAELTQELATFCLENDI